MRYQGYQNDIEKISVRYLSCMAHMSGRTARNGWSIGATNEKAMLLNRNHASLTVCGVARVQYIETIFHKRHSLLSCSAAKDFEDGQHEERVVLTEYTEGDCSLI
jgi:hypothetical protein